MSAPFRTTRRVEFHDTDMAGMVHFANFFRYMESAEVEYWHSRGLSVIIRQQEERLSFPRVSASCDFLKPALFEDLLDIEVRVARLGSKSVTFAFEIFKAADVIARGQITAVCCRVAPGGRSSRLKSHRPWASGYNEVGCITTKLAMSLKTSHLTKSYPTPSGPLNVLRDVNLEANRGEALAIMGPSGSGKSTLLHILGTLDAPTSGSVHLAGKDPFALPERALADFRNRNVGFVFQDHHLLPQCSVLENVLIPTLVNREGRADAELWGMQLLARVGLSDRLDHRPAELSGGERQRVAVARALIRHPLLLLADEPTGNLDRHSAQAVAKLLLDLHRQEQNMLIVVTHSLELAQLFPQRMEMVDGTLDKAETTA